MGNWCWNCFWWPGWFWWCLTLVDCTVSTLRERLSFAQDKLQVAISNPGNAASLITREPGPAGRTITDEQKRCLISTFEDMNEKFVGVVIIAFPDEEPQKYAIQFLNIFFAYGLSLGCPARDAWEL